MQHVQSEHWKWGFTFIYKSRICDVDCTSSTLSHIWVFELKKLWRSDQIHSVFKKYLVELTKDNSLCCVVVNNVCNWVYLPKYSTYFEYNFKCLYYYISIIYRAIVTGHVADQDFRYKVHDHHAAIRMICSCMSTFAFDI